MQESHSRHQMITLEAILNYIHEGVEWKPLNMNIDQADKQHISRKEIIRVIQDYATDMPLNILYDSCFISYDSNFCENEQPELISVQAAVVLKAPILIGLDVLQSLRAMLLLDKPSVTVLGMSARTLGNVDILCPCETRDSTRINAIHVCALHHSICSLRGIDSDSEMNSDFDRIFPDCLAADENQNQAQIVYAKSNVLYVRSLLHKHDARLKMNEFECSTMMPSDRWGLSPSHFTNLHYLNASRVGSLQYDAMHMLLHPKSGVSLLNLDYVKQNMHTILSEGDHKVSCSCVLHFFTQESFTQRRYYVFNFMCIICPKRHKSCMF